MQLKNFFSVISACKGLRSKGASRKSVLTFFWAEIATRLSRLRIAKGWENAPLTISFDDGFVLHFRQNKGDLQSIREVWVEEHYSLPSTTGKRVLVDLGANIGLSSLWLARKYGLKEIIAVEPDPANFALLEKNLKQNAIDAILFQAAVGPKNGVAYFSSASCSNAGHLSDTGVPTTVVSMESILAKLPADTMVDVLKMDIEGGEESLFSENTDWLSRVEFIITELHPDVCDTNGVIEVGKAAGFRFLPGAGIDGKVKDQAVMDTFSRLHG